MARFFGTPVGVHVGQQFIDRADVRASGLHAPTQAGISGTKLEGADSIVLSSGYPEDEDFGDYIIYTGEGGQDSNRKQIADQRVESPGNAGLITSWTAGLPVRVLRGSRHKSPFSPKGGYRYAGLYRVTDFWQHRRQSDGFVVLRFRLERLDEQAPYVASIDPISDPAFATSTTTRRIRDTALTRQVKALYDFACQVCSEQISGLSGRLYAEGAHVRPLGNPHLGDDALSNILCLCPNHHVEFDLGGSYIADDFSVVKSDTGAPFAQLQFAKQHVLNVENVRYHRDFWVKPTPLHTVA
ncbi:MAG TPA: YDG/SRA domain-containing protein [Galbitalea sp.]|jgi:putative restriction endonuclease